MWYPKGVVLARLHKKSKSGVLGFVISVGAAERVTEKGNWSGEDGSEAVEELFVESEVEEPSCASEKPV